MKAGIGLDAGGTDTKLAAAGADGRVLRVADFPTAAELGPKDFVARAAGAVRTIEKGLGRKLPVCLAVAGDVDPVKGRLRRAPNLPGFEGFPLGAALGKALGRKIAVHNDANMACWGAYRIELKSRYASVAALTLGTGVGGGIVLNGRLLTGATGSAGEIGHMRVVPGGRACRCGAHGCLEAYAGAFGIRSITGIDPKTAADAARAGDASALAVWASVGDALGAGIVNLVYLLNPDIVVLTGGVARASALFLPRVREALRSESFRAPFGRVKLRASRRSDLGCVGAALYALEGPAA